MRIVYKTEGVMRLFYIFIQERCLVHTCTYYATQYLWYNSDIWAAVLALKCITLEVTLSRRFPTISALWMRHARELICRIKTIPVLEGLGTSMHWGVFCSVLYCAILCYSVLYCAILCCTVLYCAIVCYTVLYCAVLYCAILCCTVLYCAIVCYTVLYCAILCYSVLTCAILFYTLL
jgi:hypothetical protein